MFLSGRPSHAFGCPLVLRSFEQFKVASVRMSQQHVRTLLIFREDSSSPLQTWIGKTTCTHLDAILVMEITCRKSATIRMQP
jgi:hypothetical protein